MSRVPRQRVLVPVVVADLPGVPVADRVLDVTHRHPGIERHGCLYDGEQGGPFRRCACGRWKATDNQYHRWLEWCWRYEVPPWRRWLVIQPLWWRLSTRCLGWYDCAASYAPTDPIKDHPWHVRLLFRIPRRADP